jgi:hypothetical protein
VNFRDPHFNTVIFGSRIKTLKLIHSFSCLYLRSILRTSFLMVCCRQSTQIHRRNCTMHWLRNFPQSEVCPWILRLVTWLCAGLTTPWGDSTPVFWLFCSTEQLCSSCCYLVVVFCHHFVSTFITMLKWCKDYSYHAQL